MDVYDTERAGETRALRNRASSSATRPARSIVRHCGMEKKSGDCGLRSTSVSEGIDGLSRRTRPAMPRRARRPDQQRLVGAKQRDVPDSGDSLPDLPSREAFWWQLWPGIGTWKRPKVFWSIDRWDVALIGVNAALTLLLWVVSFHLSDRYVIAAYWDGPNYISLAKNMYRVGNNDPLIVAYGADVYNKSYFACHLPMYPVWIRLWGFVTMGQFEVGFHLAVIAQSWLFVYALRRMLWAYGVVDNVLAACVLASVFPLRWTVYRAVGASEPLYEALVCLALTLLRTRQYFAMTVVVGMACLTRIDGLALLGTCGLCLLFRGDVLAAIGSGFAILSDVGLLLFHQLRFGAWDAYWRYNQGSQRLIHWPPFSWALGTFGGTSYAEASSFLVLFVPWLVGLASLFLMAVPLGIFSAVYFVFAGSLFHIDIYRYALPGVFMALIVGFDALWSSREFARARWPIAVCYACLALWYDAGQILSNSAGSDHVRAVYRNVPIHLF